MVSMVLRENVNLSPSKEFVDKQKLWVCLATYIAQNLSYFKFNKFSEV